jgi:CheY-like chemotaxis protein
VELLSVAYGEFPDLFEDKDRPQGWQATCLKVKLSVDPALIGDRGTSDKIVDQLAPVFPTVRSVPPVTSESGLQGELERIARWTAAIVVDLQRDLCEWPVRFRCRCQGLDAGQTYELCVESVDERVGLFAAQLAVEVMRRTLRQKRFDRRLTWVIDLVRHLRHRPRLRLTPRRVAGLLGCSRNDARWAMEELERYGYLSVGEMRRPHPTKGGCILIVDDNAQVRDLLSRILERLGHTVITAVDGEEGLILLDWMDYKAIFVDLIMPSLDGPTFLQCARSQGITCPIFAISAYDHRWNPDKLETLGATAYVAKPFSIAEIQALIKKHVK